jgi:hypothetical protein
MAIAMPLRGAFLIVLLMFNPFGIHSMGCRTNLPERIFRASYWTIRIAASSTVSNDDPMLATLGSKSFALHCLTS